MNKNLGVLLPFLMMSGLNDYPVNKGYDKFEDIKFLEKEYNLIQEKKSMLSSSERRRVVYIYEKIKKDQLPHA